MAFVGALREAPLLIDYLIYGAAGIIKVCPA